MMIVPKIPSPAKKTMRKSSDIPASIVKSEEKKTEKPPFRLAVDDTKPVLQDPVKKKKDLDFLSVLEFEFEIELFMRFCWITKSVEFDDI